MPGVGDDPATLSVIGRGPFQQSDHQPPSIVLTSPGAGLATNHNLLVAGRVTDALSGVASLQAQVDAGAFFNVAFDSSGAFHFDTALPLNGTADGSHTIHLRATSRAGNVSSPVSFSFTLDTIAPTIIITSPASGLITNANPTIAGTVTDAGSGVKLLQARSMAARRRRSRWSAAGSSSPRSWR